MYTGQAKTEREEDAASCKGRFPEHVQWIPAVAFIA